MGLSVKGGQINTPASGGNLPITGVGFQPTLIYLYSTVHASQTLLDWVTVGFGTSSSARWSQSGETSFAAGACRLFDSSKIFRAVYLSGGVVTDSIVADLVSMDSDGFTLNFTVTPGTGYVINYVCVAGSDFNAHVGFMSFTAATGNQSQTGVGFPPKAVMFSTGDSSTSDGVGANVLMFGPGFGAATSSSARAFVAPGTSADGNNEGGVLAENRCWVTLFPETTVYSEADFVSLDSDGFTINVLTTDTGFTWHVPYVAMGGTAQYFTGTFTQATSTGNQSVTGVGFPPSVELFWSGGKTSNNTPTTPNRLALGHAVSSADRGSLWGSRMHNVSNEHESVITNTTKCLTVTVDDTNTVLADADFVSQDSGGFTINNTTADATARQYGYLAIGAAAAAGSDNFDWLQRFPPLHAAYRPTYIQVP